MSDICRREQIADPPIRSVSARAPARRPPRTRAHACVSAHVPWSNPLTFPFNETSVILNAPPQPGIYALYNKATWVYIGESENVETQLLQHLRGDVACITMYPELSFSYELAPSTAARARRMKDVVREFRPVCNPRSGD
jgi:hypothetical protein